MKLYSNKLYICAQRLERKMQEIKMNEPYQLLKEGLALALEGKYNEAVEKYAQAIELDPNNKEAYKSWGNAMFALAELAGDDKRQELYDKAIEKYAQATELDPNYMEAYNNWGLLLFNLAELADGDKKQELYRETIEKYAQVIELAPNLKEVYYNLGNALSALAKLAGGDQRQELYREAIEKYVQAIELDPKFKEAYNILGNTLSDLAELACGDQRQELYRETIEKYAQAIELDPNYKAVYYNWGTVLSDWAELVSDDKKQKLYRESIEKYAKAIELAPNNADAYYNLGNALLNLAKIAGDDQKQELYNKAIEKYAQAIELDPNDKEAYYNWGIVLFNLAELAGGDKRQELCSKAIEKFAQTIELDPKYKAAYNSWGNALSALAGLEGDEALYRKTIEKYVQAIELAPNYKEAYNNWGTALSALARLSGGDKKQELYSKAITKFIKAIELDPNYKVAYYNLGNALFASSELVSEVKKQELYNEAIIQFKKVIELDPNDKAAYNNWGNALSALAELEGDKDLYGAAIEKYDIAIKLDSNYSMAHINKGLTIYESGGAAEDIATCFSNAELKIFDILSIGKKTDRKTDQQLKKEILNYMLDTDSNRESPIEFFTKLLKIYDLNYSKKSGSKFQQLKKIYIQSLLIISLSHVKNENDIDVAHYTSISTAKLLLFKNKSEGRAEPAQLRMTSVATTNDPKEGITLLDFLDIETTKDKSEEEHTAFVSCFTFNHNNLTQFRLYGNKNNVEGTGLSIVLHHNFFNSFMTDYLSAEPKMAGDFQPSKTDTKENRCALYRCIYLDPDVEQVISLGHRDEYAFYLLQEEKEIKGYNKEINDKLKAVRTGFNVLKKLTSNYKGDHAILTPLLLQLRYLTKHAAFKEEQECRILDIASENDKGKRDDKSKKIYINYAQIEKRHICRIYFAPKAADYTSFCNSLKLNGIESPCEKSKHPLA